MPAAGISVEAAITAVEAAAACAVRRLITSASSRETTGVSRSSLYGAPAAARSESSRAVVGGGRRNWCRKGRRGALPDCGEEDAMNKTSHYGMDMISNKNVKSANVFSL